ncbi:MAG: S8 family serine peptidase [Cyanobacteriota bacterium]
MSSAFSDLPGLPRELPLQDWLDQVPDRRSSSPWSPPQATVPGGAAVPASAVEPGWIAGQALGPAAAIDAPAEDKPLGSPAPAGSDDGWLVAQGIPDDAPAPATTEEAVPPTPAPRARIMVQWDSAATEQDRTEALVNLGGSCKERIHTAVMTARGEGVLEVIEVAGGASLEAVLAAYRQRDGVRFAEVDQLFQPQLVSNDPSYANGSLWGMYGNDSPTAAGPAGTSNTFGSNAEAAWDRGFSGSKSVLVGIVDEGYEFTHPDLAANAWLNPFESLEGVDNDGNGYIDDVRGWDFYNNDNSVYDGSGDDHGTHVAGTIGASGGNGIGVAGVNWNVSLIAAKFLGPNGGYLSGAIQALDYITDIKSRHGLNIVATNNSWLGGGYSQGLHEAIIRGAKQDILFVAAAGNAASNNDSSPSYPSTLDTSKGTNTLPPASYDAVVAVASLSSNGTLSSFSSYGKTTVDLGAPGASILSTLPGGTYGSYSGTSMATPHVSGAIALYAASHPGSTAEQIRAALLASATPTPSLTGKTVSGGRLDVLNFLNTWSQARLTIAADQEALTEGQSGSTPFRFLVNRSDLTTVTTTVSWLVAGCGPAPANAQDFAGGLLPSGTLTFAPGETAKTISINVAGDSLVEATETFRVTLSGATGSATIATASATGTISNDDAPTTTAIITAVSDDLGPLQGQVAPGASSDDLTPTLSGTLSAPLASDEALLIFNDGAALLGTAVTTGQSWTLTPTLPPSAGTSYSLTARVASLFGPFGPVSPSLSFVLDSTAPTTTAAITAVEDNLAALQGSLADGAATDDSTPTLSGTLSAPLVDGETLRVFNGSTPLGSASVHTTSCTWSFTPEASLTAGTYSFTVAVTDAAGNTGPASASHSLLLDTSAPTTTVSINAIDDDNGLLQGLVPSGGSSDDLTPSLSGTLSAPLAPGESLLVSSDGNLLPESTTVSGQSWTFTPTLSPSPGTSYAFSARVVSPLGALGPASTAFPFQLDSSAPTATAAIVDVTDNVGDVQGSVAEGAATDDAAPTLSGPLSDPLASGESLGVFNGSTLLGSASVNSATSTWTYTPASLLTAGTHAFSVAVIDAAGNTGPASASRVLSVINSISITGVSDDVGLLQGTVVPGGRSDDLTPTISGTLSAPLARGESLVLTNNDTSLLGTATVSGLSWSLTPTLPPSAGASYVLTARVASASGALGSASASRVFVLDTIAPTTTAALVQATDNVGLRQGSVAPGTSTDDTTPTLAGTLSAPLAGGETLRVFNGSALLGSASVNNTTRSWTYTPASSLTAGSHLFSVAVADGAGNTGPAASAFSLTVDTVTPSTTATIDAVSDDAGLLQGPVAAGGRSDDLTPTLSGSLSAGLANGESLLVYSNGTAPLGTATVSGQSWSFTPSLSPSAGTAHAFTARVVSALGALGSASASRTVRLDTTPPATTAAITGVSDNVGATQSSLADGGSTDDSTPTLTGTLSGALASGETLRVFNGSALLGSASVNNTARTWSFTPSPGLDPGLHAFSVAVADAAGNLGLASASRALTVDTTAPTLTISSGTSALKAGETATITFTFSEDPGSSFSWTGGSGDVAVMGGTLSALSGTGLTRTARFTPNPNSSGTASISVPRGAYSDGAGNPGEAANPLTLVYDTWFSSDAHIRLYDASLPAPPADQGWLVFGSGFAGSQSPSPTGTLLNSLAWIADGAGFSNHTPLGGDPVNTTFPALDRSVGFSLDVQLRLINEIHSTSNRAGFSLTLLDQGSAPRGIELGFWSNSIFSQAGGATPFQAIAQVVNGVDTSQSTSYSLRIQDQSYTLLANNRPLLCGPLQDYSQATVAAPFPYNPYAKPNFLFLGDNTSSAAAQVELGTIALGIPLTGSTGSDSMTGTSGPDRLNGLEGDDSIEAGAAADWLIGGSGADRLAGGDGDDLLSGGSGLDRFVFGGTAPFNASALGVDGIVGFNRMEDRLLLAGATFTALAPGPSLPSGGFALVNNDGAAASSNALIVYNTLNGGVFYNPNGNAPGFATTLEGGGRFAMIMASASGGTLPTLSASSFQII